MIPYDAPNPRMRVPILFGDTYKEPLSGKLVKVSSARTLSGPGFSDAGVVPCAGGYTALLDASVLACQVRVIDSLKAYMDALTGRVLGILILYYLLYIVNKLSSVTKTCCRSRSCCPRSVIQRTSGSNTARIFSQGTSCSTKQKYC